MIEMGGKVDPEQATYIFSRTVPSGDHMGGIVVSGSAKTLVDDIRKQPGKNMWLMGGGDLARHFLAEDCIDEIHLGIVPVLIGAGLPAFPSGFPQREFELYENKTYSKGLIGLKYRRRPARQ
jgi:dihydrofolate reductase